VATKNQVVRIMNVRAIALAGSVSVLAAVGTTACDQPTTPTRAPAQSSPSASPPPVAQNATVSGVVWRHAADGVSPYGTASVWGWIQTERSGYRVGPTQSGADGRYSFTVPIGALLRVQLAATYQPCVAAISASSHTDLGVHLVVDTAQLGAHLPAELLADTPTLSGVVFENTADGRQLVPGVRVEVDMLYGLGDVSATTLTDSDGRYVLCGFAGTASTYVYASKAGFKLADVGTVSLNGNTVRDIEMHR
jgi:hypothetical protein